MGLLKGAYEFFRMNTWLGEPVVWGIGSCRVFGIDQWSIQITLRVLQRQLNQSQKAIAYWELSERADRLSDFSLKHLNEAFKTKSCRRLSPSDFPIRQPLMALHTCKHCRVTASSKRNVMTPHLPASFLLSIWEEVGSACALTCSLPSGLMG